MAIIDIITAAGEWAHGGSPYLIADEWERAGFDEDEVEAWLHTARCFDALAADRLRAAGVTPEQAAAKVERGGVADTVGYWYANNDLLLEQALEAIRIAGFEAWDPTDRDLLQRLGRDEVTAWRSHAWEARDYETVDLLDASGLTGLSRWETLAQRAQRDGVSEATIRRAVARGLTSRRVGRRLEVDATEPLPAVDRPGPHHHYVVREPWMPAWWEGTTRYEAERQLRAARRQGLHMARILRDGEWLE